MLCCGQTMHHKMCSASAVFHRIFLSSFVFVVIRLVFSFILLYFFIFFSLPLLFGIIVHLAMSFGSRERHHHRHHSRFDDQAAHGRHATQPRRPTTFHTNFFFQAPSGSGWRALSFHSKNIRRTKIQRANLQRVGIIVFCAEFCILIIA